VTRVYAAFAFLCVVFGTTFGAIKIGIEDGWPPLLAAGARFTLAGAIVLAVAAARGELRPLRAVDFRAIVAIGLTVTTGTFGALYSAERILPSGLAALLSATSPLFAVGLAVATKKRAFDTAVVAGIALGSSGVVLVAGLGSIAGVASLAASCAIVLSVVGYAWGLSQARRASEAIPMLELAGVQQLLGGLILLVLSLGFEHRGPTHAAALGIGALIYLVVVASAGAHTVSIWLASRTDATLATSWTYVSPFVALIFGAVWLHEPVGAFAWIGGVCVVAGALMLNRDVRSHVTGHDATRAEMLGGTSEALR